MTLNLVLEIAIVIHWITLLVMKMVAYRRVKHRPESQHYKCSYAIINCLFWFLTVEIIIIVPFFI